MANATDQQIQQLLDQSLNRTAYQNPLFQAVTQMAYQGLPTYARQGTNLSGTLSNQVPAATATSGGGMNPLAAGGLGALGALAGDALSGGNLAGLLGELIKKMLGKGGGSGTVQGDKPYAGGALMGPNTIPSGDFGNSWNTNLPWNPPLLQSRQLTPNVTTSEDFRLPDYLPSSDPFGGFGAPTSYPSDPSRGSGVGPGMASFYGMFPPLATPNEE